MNYMKQDFYDQLTLRNGFFISRDLQLKIKECSLVLAGCGLSSNFAVLAARLGFEKFILIDGDNVDESNLNRQPFSLNHVGLNKAEAISEIIKQINQNQASSSLHVFLLAQKQLLQKQRACQNKCRNEKAVSHNAYYKTKPNKNS